ncbi:hypothetical protein ACJMK2_041562 [Sinanodonta woodiana]|uniref:Cystinosin homolog n=1 Tax=Sinanodonta woodiana TaxID=1069815 RepID=A0ABD3W6F6_SINWO
MFKKYWLPLVLQALLLFFNFTTVHSVTLAFSDQDIQVVINGNSSLKLVASAPLTEDATIRFTYQIGDGNIEFYQQDSELIENLPNVTIKNGTKDITVFIVGKNPGHLTLGVNSNSSSFENLEDTFLLVTIVQNSALVIISSVIGWIYFAAWTISFYPQVYENFRRKSVVGLNFDFLGLNITGFFTYGLFNIGMYWIPEVENDYKKLHPRGINPVELNDVIFTIHAVFITAVTIIQCLIYKRDMQRVSIVARVLLVGIWLFVAVALIVALCKTITWLTYLYYFSYIKLGITLIKYIPQAYMNFRRKSTEGWSIGNVLLDFTGGSFSILQMFLLSYNNDDWGSIFGNPTKFGLGFFSILFDILFIIQHYILYRHHASYEILIDSPEKDIEDVLKPSST